MKVSELPPTMQLCNTKVRIPDNIKLPTGLATREVYIRSIWNLGLWLKENSTNDGQVFPLTPFNPVDACEWEVV